MIEGKDYTDTAILDATRWNTQDNGRVQYAIVLPSGRSLTSEWMEQDVARKMAVTWCDSVRQEIEADVQEAKAKKQRGAFDTEPAPTAEPATGQARTMTTTVPAGEATGTFETDDPEGLVKRTIDRLFEEQKDLLARKTAIHQRLMEVSGKLDSWKAVALTLGIDLTGESDDDDRESAEAPGEADDSCDSDADSSGLRPGGSDVNRAGGSGPEDRDAGLDEGDDHDPEPGDDVD